MHDRHGVVLLEVLAALTIFAFSAASALVLLGQLADAQRRAHADERRVADQDRLLVGYALLTREDLDRQLGTRPLGDYAVSVQRPVPTLYRVTIGDSSGVELATLLYRPEAIRAP